MYKYCKSNMVLTFKKKIIDSHVLLKPIDLLR